MAQIKAFDLFCGIGGLSYGLKRAGIAVGGGLDVDPTCRFAYEENCDAAFVEEDICSVNYADISPYLKGADYQVLVGCAPCQPFSPHIRGAHRASGDNRWHLIEQFSRIAAEGRPHIVSMENVPNLAKKPVFDKFVRDLEGLGYFVSHGVLDCHRFGVPQRRRRLVLLGSLLGPIELPEPVLPQSAGGNRRTASQATVAQATVFQAIGDMPPIEHGTHCESDRFHVCSALSEINLKRIRNSVPGGSWRTWPKNLQLDCHKKPSGQTYAPVYGRMEWDKPAPTLTTQFMRYGTGRYGHPEQNRALSLREGALLQTFPRDYKFWPEDDQIILTTISKHIGNAVPPLLAEKIGNAITKHLEENNDN